ncbi:MAG: V-type ATP synthase subunit E [Candidatus Caldarchaeum sp.]|nr:V-type ATP synthase subunit E [Candidatus Caldarchaeum sp.]
MSTSLSKVVNEVLQEALSKAIKTIEEGEAEAMRIISKTEEELMREINSMQEAGKSSREAAIQRILSTAEIQAKNMAIAAVEEEITKIFDDVLKKLVEESRRPAFKPVMESLLDEAVNLLGRDMVVESDEHGIRMLKEITASKTYSVKVVVSEKPVSLMGGLKASSLDGTLRFDNSLEARLERLKPMLRTEIAKMLLSKE